MPTETERPALRTHLSHIYKPEQVVAAFNTGYSLLRDHAKSGKLSGAFDQKQIEEDLKVTEWSLGQAGVGKYGLTLGAATNFTIPHEFSRSKRDDESRTTVDIEAGVVSSGVSRHLYRLETLHREEAAALNNMKGKGWLTDEDTRRKSTDLTYRFNYLGQVLTDNSLKYSHHFYDETHPDWEPVVEYYAGVVRHFNESGLDSSLAPSLEHSEEDWHNAIKQIKEMSLLILPPEDAVMDSSKGRNRWYSGCLPTGCLPIASGLALITLVAVSLSDCNPFITPTANRPEASPTAQIAAKPVGPEVGIVQGVPTVEIRPTLVPQGEVAPADEECVPDNIISITEIVQPGDRDANRIYYYPNKVNSSGDSVKGLFEKELASAYVKDNPFSDEAIRYSLRNQKNDGRDIASSDPDLLLLIDEAKEFYGQDISDAAILAFIDSIKRNNPDGTLDKDKIIANQFKAQSPSSILHRLQALKRG